MIVIPVRYLLHLRSVDCSRGEMSHRKYCCYGDWPMKIRRILVEICYVLPWISFVNTILFYNQ